MVRVDLDRDYYGDLELSPSATAQDVKNQFRKLAMKWHPDRNHGREEEAKAKFVIIQSAQEILLDPTKRAKYDAERKPRQARYPTASGVRGNPYQDVSAQFPVPPKRPSQRPPMPTRPTASGASRYASFAKPTANQGSPRTDPKENAKAWESMRPSNAMPGQQAKPASQGASAGSTPRRARADVPPTTPRTRSQQQKAEASFGARRGFVPASPMGDEQPATSKHYSTTRSRAAPYDDSSSYNSPPFAASSENDEAENAQFDKSQFTARERTPYTSHIGERTTLYPGVGRASSVKDRRTGTERQQDDATPTAASRPRRASIDASPRPTTTAEDAGADSATSMNDSTNAMPKSAPATATFPPNATTSDGMQGNFGFGSANPQRNPNVFSFEIDHATFQKAKSWAQQEDMRTGQQNTSTQFGDSRATQEYRFQGGGHSTETVDPFTAARRSRRNKMKTRGSESPLKSVSPVPSGSGESEVPGGAEKKPGSFNADEWKAQIGIQNFVPAPSTSPTRPRPMKKPKPVKTTTTAGGSARMVDDDDDDDDASSSEDKTRPQSAAGQDMGGTPSPNAMDIDAPETGPAVPRSSSARNIPVEPSRPEWRAGNVHGAKPGGASSLPAADIPSSGHAKPTVTGSEDSDDLLQPNSAFVNFEKSFQGLEPLIAPAAGLSSFNDLKSNLPFPSQAAPKIHITSDRPKPITDFPAKPVAPRPPVALGVAGLLPNQSEWQRYSRDVMAYMAKWTDYRAWFTNFFAARQKQLEEGPRANGFTFLDARGDDGIEEYMEWIEQEKHARQQWGAACDEHEVLVRDFARHRTLMKR